MSNVDKFFKSKLENDQLAPGPKAWETVANHLSKKNNTRLVLRWAAVFLLGGLLTVSLVSRNESSAPEELTEQKTEKAVEPQKGELQETTHLAEKTPSIAPKTSVIPNRDQNTSSGNTVSQAEPLAAMEKEPLIAANEEMPNPIADVPVGNALPELTSEKSFVLVYSLPPRSSATNAKVVSNLPEEEAEPTGIKKIWEAAKDAKNSDNPWGDLREAKNELLALDFKRDKNRNQ